MSWLSDTVAGRTIIVLVVGLGSILGIAQHLYQSGIEREVSISNTQSIVERLLDLSNTILAIDPERRDDAAHRLSGGALELHWGREPLAVAGGALDPATLRLRDDRHTTLVSIPLADGSWLNVTLARVEAARASTPSALLSAMLGALGIVLVSILMSRWLTQPLERLSDGARRLFQTSHNAPLPETGTREVRTLAAAINDLQQRIGKLVDERTQMLAAVSHDLRSPLTRLRLRAAGVGSSDVRQAIESDLDEMEAMINATLAFLRDDFAKEEVEPVDIMAILETIAADATDAGQAVELEGPRHLVMSGRHVALKRALTNLVQNAVIYGGNAKINAAGSNGDIRISIVDEGPGISPALLDGVFEPFARGEPSRARNTGGHGLGLTVARSILRSHGGDVVLVNSRDRGLEARVTLPVAKPD